jgi:xylulokinase
MGCILCAASSYKWWLDNILKSDDYAGEQREITKLGENSVFFLPALMGERSPVNDPNARGVFLGMTLDTTRADMTQAIMEGVAFSLRSSLRIAGYLGVEAREATICGGGAKSELWCNIIANVIGIPISTTEVEEGPAYGSAILASVGCGRYKSVQEACSKLIKIKKTYECKPELVAKYNKQYEKFRKIYYPLKPVFSALRD